MYQFSLLAFLLLSMVVSMMCQKHDAPAPAPARSRDPVSFSDKIARVPESLSGIETFNCTQCFDRTWGNNLNKVRMLQETAVEFFKVTFQPTSNEDGSFNQLTCFCQIVPATSKPRKIPSNQQEKIIPTDSPTNAPTVQVEVKGSSASGVTTVVAVSSVASIFVMAWFVYYLYGRYNQPYNEFPECTDDESEKNGSVKL